MKPRPMQKKRKPRRSNADGPRLRAPKVKVEDIDYKDVAMLQRVTSAQGKMFSRKRTGQTAEGQRKLALALKRARFLALMPYVT